MTNVTAASSLSTQGTQLNSSGTSMTTAASASLGQNQFLQLMMDQLRHQDPTSPSDPSQYLSELAQFSSLEQMNNVATSTTSGATDTANTQAIALIGHSVTYTDASGAGQTGTVSKVQFTSSGPTLTIGSSSGVPLTSVTEAS
jgi:flagellar basal-body rod modification protein FlgD